MTNSDDQRNIPYSNFNPLKMIMGVAEASTLWHLEQSTIKKMCQSGKIESVKIGDTWIIRKDEKQPERKRKRNLKNN